MLKKLQNKLKNNKGFSLVELIVVIAIMVILIAMLIPNVLGYIDSASKTADLATASSIYTATTQSIATQKAQTGKIEAEFDPFDETDATAAPIQSLVNGSVEWAKCEVYLNADRTSVVAVRYKNAVYPQEYKATAGDNGGIEDIPTDSVKLKSPTN